MNIKSLLFPSDFTCDICGVETFKSNLCDGCRKTVKFNDGTTCPLCGRRTIAPGICLECKDLPPVYDKAVSALVYDGGGQILVYKFKHGCGYLKDYFSDLLLPKIRALPRVDCIVSVPMLRRDKRARGYNQSDLLAKTLSARSGIEYLRGALTKVRKSEQQKSLTRKKRAENLKGCFKVEKPELFEGKTVLIVDDVLTTGATAEEITRVLVSAGAKAVYVATVASVEFKIRHSEPLAKNPKD